MAFLRALTGLVAGLWLATPAFAADPPVQRPMSEMNGGCGDFGWNMTAELAAWTGKAASLAAGTTEASAPDAGGPLVPLAVTLALQDRVTFAAPPEKAPEAGRYGGLLRVTAPAAGFLRVSTEKGVWIDVVDGGARVEEAGFERQAQCESVHKSVAFPVHAGQVLVVQLSNAGAPEVKAMLSMAP